MGIKLKTLLAQSLHEQSVDQKMVNRAYDQTVNAVKGLGTDVDGVLNALRLLRNKNEFVRYWLLFRNGKSGYKSFDEMINAEYDRFNAKDVEKIVARLRQLGIDASSLYAQNRFGTQLFDKFKTNINSFYSAPQKEKPSWAKLAKQRQIATLKQDWLSALPKAVAFWKSWLSDPITQQKVQKNWDAWYASGKFQVKTIWPKYFKMLNKLHIKFYDKNSGYQYNNLLSAYAFVTEESAVDSTIYINLEHNALEKFDILVHEIQHIIYDIKPLNPEKKIKNAFVTKNTKRDTPSDIQSSIESSISKSYDAILKKAERVIASLKLDTTPYVLLSRWKFDPGREGDPGYTCRETEKMSNIMSIRNYFKLKPGQNITVNMLKPYIEGKKRHIDITWMLKCWGENNFPDLNTMLNRINMLAKNDTPNRNTSNIA